MEEERKKLEEIMSALPLCFLGKDGRKIHEEVIRKVKELEEKEKVD